MAIVFVVAEQILDLKVMIIKVVQGMPILVASIEEQIKLIQTAMHSFSLLEVGKADRCPPCSSLILRYLQYIKKIQWPPTAAGASCWSWSCWRVQCTTPGPCLKFQTVAKIRFTSF